MRVLTLLALGAAVQAHGRDNPIRRIVTLLQNMQQEIEHEQVEAKDMYDKFMCFCDNNIAQAKTEIADGTTLISGLESTLQEVTGSNAQITAELADVSSELAESQKSVDEQKAVRSQEAQAFFDESTTTKTSIAAIDTALPKLEQGVSMTQQVAMLQQLHMSVRMHTAKPDPLPELLEMMSNDQAAGGSSAGKSTDMIIGVLKQMRDDFKIGLEDMVQEEQEAINRFDALISSKKAEITAAQDEHDKLKGQQSTNSEVLAEAKSEHTKASFGMEKAQNRLIDLTKQCSSRSTEYDAATKGRQEELKAVGQAVKILNDDSALDLFKKTVPSDEALVQHAVVRSADKDPAAAAWEEMSARKAATNVMDEILGPSFMQASAKPAMAPVIKLVSDMATNLKKQQGDDDEQKRWCEKELASTETSSKETKQKAELLSQEIATMKNTKESLRSKLAANVDIVKRQDDSVKAAGDTRKAENAKYTQVLSDQTAAIALIEKAKAVLAGVYSSKPALLQAPTDPMDTMLSLSLVQMEQVASDEELDQVLMQVGQDAAQQQPVERTKQSGGVVSLMDQMKHDIEVEIAELRKDEEQDQAGYEQLVSDSASERKAKMIERTGLQEAHAKIDEKLDVRSMALKGYEEEVNSLSKKQSALHDQCDFLLENFDIREQARGQEIEGLARSQAVLSGAKFDLHQKRLLRG